MEPQVDQDAQTAPVRPKGFVKPKPGAFPVKQKVVMSHTPGEEGTFIHDFRFPGTLSSVLASRVHAHEERLNNDPQHFDAYSDRVYRMICMLMARKLATSLSEDQRARFGGYLRSIVNMPTWAPSPLIPLIDMFGCVEYEKLRFTMVGQPILAYTYFCRATTRDLQDRENFIAINAHWPQAKRMLRDFCVEYINSWARSKTNELFNFGEGVQVRMSVPLFQAGVVGYRQFIQGLIDDPRVLRMMDILTIIEQTVDQPFVQAQIQALAGHNVGVNNQSTSLIVEAGERYSTEVEARLRTSFSAVTNWVSIAAMKNRGSPGQLLRRETEHMFYSPIMLGGESIDLGWMAAGENTYVTVNARACHLVPTETIRQGQVGYVETMMKHNF